MWHAKPKELPTLAVQYPIRQCNWNFLSVFMVLQVFVTFLFGETEFNSIFSMSFVLAKFWKTLLKISAKLNSTKNNWQKPVLFWKSRTEFEAKPDPNFRLKPANFSLLWGSGLDLASNLIPDFRYCPISNKNSQNNQIRFQQKIFYFLNEKHCPSIQYWLFWTTG